MCKRLRNDWISDPCGRRDARTFAALHPPKPPKKWGNAMIAILPRRRRTLLAGLSVVALAALVLAQFVRPSAAQTSPEPPPPSVGTGIPQSYFGPQPSQTLGEDNERLVGPVQLLRSGRFDAQAMTITLPLYRGQMRDGRSVWFILTDTTDKENAIGLGLNFSSKLAYAAVGHAARDAVLEEDTSLTFRRGAVDFSPERTVQPGPESAPFPPAVAEPGSVGDEYYTPLVRLVNQPGTPIYNAPVVAFDATPEEISFCDGSPDYSLVHDRVTAICPNPPEEADSTADGNGSGTVTIALTPIFSFARPSVYMSTEATDAVTAALDMGTFAPALADIQTGRDDSAFSAIERLFPIANGPTGADNPQRQGLNSALLDGLPPMHVIGGLPTIALDYSPLWDLNLGEWTQDAIDRGYRSRVIDEFQLLGLVEDGWITGPGGAPFGSTGIIVNCPIVARLL